MSEMIERGAMAAFWNWRNIPLLPEAEMRKAWDAMADPMKEPWRRTARMVMKAIREPTQAMEDAAFDIEASGREEPYVGSGARPAWQAMLDEALK